MQRSLPDHAPLILAEFVCHTCGKIMEKEIIKSRRGVECIRYKCYNEATGCSYHVETNNMTTATPTPSRPPVEKVEA